MYKYYIDVDWFPICSVNSERYKINKSCITKPKIIEKHSNNIYEVSDPYLFYCETPDEYEYFVYYIDNILRIVKYRPIGSPKADFRICVKASSISGIIIENLMPCNIQSVVFPKLFNLHIYNEIKAPVFIKKEYPDSVFCDLITDNDNNLLISLAYTNKFIKIGKSGNSFRAKAEVQFTGKIINVNIFDIYEFDGKIIRRPYNERYSFLNKPCINLASYATIKIANSLDINKDELDELIIIDNDTVNYLLWKAQPTINAVMHEQKLILKDGIIENVNIDPSQKPGIVKLNTITNTITQKYDCLTLDKYSTYRLMTKRDLFSPDALKRINATIINNFAKRNAIKSWASGKTLIISDYFQSIQDILYDEVQSVTKDDCERILNEYHTIVIDNAQASQLIKIANVAKPQKNKIICFTQSTIQDAGEKTFIFLLGLVGSGKSSLIKQVRSNHATSGQLLVAQIDKLIESDIEYINNPNEETYLRLRIEIYNDKQNEIINQAILANNSIILETTHIDNDYVKRLKECKYKTIAVVVNEDFETITNNIKIRNQTKIRKTVLKRETYDLFCNNLAYYISNIDVVVYMKPSEISI